MNEITRIHLAKTPYNIELSAKKALESYLSSLESYAHDTELLHDIELRIIELLAERSVKPEGTITMNDVDALRQQLGEPEAFIDEAETNSASLGANRSAHKLYRHTNRAIFGGVSAGIAEYFNINALWVRLLLIALIFVSFGTAIIVYVVLWVVIPPVKTVADLLQLRGAPVTVSAIRDATSVDGPIESERDKKILRLVTILLGIGAVIAAAGILITTAFVGWHIRMNEGTFSYGEPEVYLWTTISLILGGVLLASLLSVAAYAAFRQKISKQIIISSVVIIILGLTTVAVVIAGGFYQSTEQQKYLVRNTAEQMLEAPVGIREIKQITVDTPEVHIDYKVDETSRIVMNSAKNTAKPRVMIKDSVLVISTNEPDREAELVYIPTSITVYGPVLDKITVENGSVVYEGRVQNSLAITATNNGSSASVVGGKIKTVTATAENNGSIDASQSSIESVNLALDRAASIVLGNIKQLTATTNEVCSADVAQSEMRVAGIVDDMVQLNGQEVSAKSSTTACTRIIFADDEATRELLY